jgi:TPP-dependent pyruvate/acetoin dehydrogenase alpha subunit
VTRAAVDRARAGEGVTLVELMTYRRRGHAEHDNQSYVTPEELAVWEQRDPIERYLRRLDETGWATADEVAAIDARIAAELDAAVARVDPEPMPEATTALDGVTASPPRAAREWYRGLDG